MRHAIAAALMLLAAMVQVTWAPRLEVFNAFPNLVLVAVVAATWIQGTRSGLIWACFGGLLLDLTSSGAIGPHALALLVPVYIVGLWTRHLDRRTAVHVALTASAATIVYSLILVGADHALGLPGPSLRVTGELAMAAAAYNALLSPFALEIVRRLDAIARLAPESA